MHGMLSFTDLPWICPNLNGFGPICSKLARFARIWSRFGISGLISATISGCFFGQIRGQKDADIRLSPAGSYFEPTTKTTIYVNDPNALKGARPGGSHHP